MLFQVLLRKWSLVWIINRSMSLKAYQTAKHCTGFIIKGDRILLLCKVAMVAVNLLFATRMLYYYHSPHNFHCKVIYQECELGCTWAANSTSCHMIFELLYGRSWGGSAIFLDDLHCFCRINFSFMSTAVRPCWLDMCESVQLIQHGGNRVHVNSSLKALLAPSAVSVVLSANWGAGATSYGCGRLPGREHVTSTKLVRKKSRCDLFYTR